MGVELDGLDSLNEAIDDIEDKWASKAEIVYAVGTNVEYAAAVEFGTSAHTITANGSEPMTFKVDGQWVSTYVVEHPGTEAQPYLRPALRAAERDLRRIADKATSKEEFMESVAAKVEAEAKRRVPVDTSNLINSIGYDRVK